MSEPVKYDDSFYHDGRQYYAHGLQAWKNFVLNDLKAQSIADFGCGQGDWLSVLQGIIPIWGCDGFANVDELRIDKSNFRNVPIDTINPKLLDVGKRDVTMSLEVMEHVTNETEGNFLDCLLSPDPRYVVFGVASGSGEYDPTQFVLNRLGEKVVGGPNWKKQWGRHHVNCQPVEVVIKKMADRGYVVDEDLSNKFCTLRVITNKGRSKLAFASFYRKNTRVYKKA